MLRRLFFVPVMVLCLLPMGCGGGGGGAPGYENDPAESSDTEQMEETEEGAEVDGGEA